MVTLKGFRIPGFFAGFSAASALPITQAAPNRAIPHYPPDRAQCIVIVPGAAKVPGDELARDVCRK